MLKLETFFLVLSMNSQIVTVQNVGENFKVWETKGKGEVGNGMIFKTNE